MANDRSNSDSTRPQANVAHAVSGAAHPPRPAPHVDARERTFVVQLAAECDPTTATLSGRVQHLRSCDGGNFRTAEDLVAIMRRVLERPQQPADE